MLLTCKVASCDRVHTGQPRASVSPHAPPTPAAAACCDHRPNDGVRGRGHRGCGRTPGCRSRRQLHLGACVMRRLSPKLPARARPLTCRQSSTSATVHFRVGARVWALPPPCTHAHTCAHTHTHAHTRTHTRTHTHARTRTHTHTHAHTRSRPCRRGPCPPSSVLPSPRCAQDDGTTPLHTAADSDHADVVRLLVAAGARVSAARAADVGHAPSGTTVVAALSYRLLSRCPDDSEVRPPRRGCGRWCEGRDGGFGLTSVSSPPPTHTKVAVRVGGFCPLPLATTTEGAHAPLPVLRCFRRRGATRPCL